MPNLPAPYFHCRDNSVWKTLWRVGIPLHSLYDQDRACSCHHVACVSSTGRVQTSGGLGWDCTGPVQDSKNQFGTVRALSKQFGA